VGAWATCAVFFVRRKLRNFNAMVLLLTYLAMFGSVADVGGSVAHDVGGSQRRFLNSAASTKYSALNLAPALPAGLSLFVGEGERRGGGDRGSGGSLEHRGPLLTHLHTVYMAYYECLPTRLNPRPG
jgi:hypothetical protein